MKLKKLLAAAVAGVAMVSLFATSAFAEITDEQAAKAVAYLAGQGIEMSASEVKDLAKDVDPDAVNVAQLKTEAASIMDDLRSGAITAEEAQVAANKALADNGAGSIQVSNVKVTVGPNGVTATADVNGNRVAAAVSYDAHPEIKDHKDANGNWNDEVPAASASAAAVAGAAGKVIKATGDNAGTVLLVSFIAIAGILGLAVRKQGENV